ncbi:hypothetical protein TrLO_g8987 [Triparma laevis f. longispina]|uniref:Aminotransferase class I/classII large domain-containing protein n=1 Tax=Triparma laevis f. longispina TaxID=1714387 RepID=A0A9W7ANI9_9STRA|nr:hypothetical protein TrLO_g8987 [Triparma laevis f. longispina]
MLFDAIGDGKDILNKKDIQDFLAECKGNIRPEAIDEIEAKAEGTCLDLELFRKWLVLATKFDSQRNSKMAKYYGKLGEQSGAIHQEPKSWNESTMAQNLRRMQYAVRGQVVMKAETLMAEGKDIIFTNIGNPHSVGQKPITFYRQVLALCDLPTEYGVDHPDCEKMFPLDVIERAREINGAIGGSGTGAYTGSQGVLKFRQDIAAFIEARDGHPCLPGNIFMTNGASSGIQAILTGLIADMNDAVMIPIPQYPIYSALIALLGGRQVGYELDEGKGWSVSKEALKAQLDKAESEGLRVKALAMINPGNPTGQVLSEEDVFTVCKFCCENGIVLLSDEVYQRNVYAPGKEFHSAKKVAMDRESELRNLQLVSFHSTSKGLIGECGRRGGYMELYNIDTFVQSQIYKLASAGLCSGVNGQIMTSLMVKPPAEGGESFDLFTKEESEIMDSMKRKAKMLVKGLNEIEGIDCEDAEGAMYAFPRIQIPQKAIDVARKKKQSPDTLYAISLLEETGLCVVPASGFGQAEGRIGFRTTFLPPDDVMENAVQDFKRHHELFCEKYA